MVTAQLAVREERRMHVTWFGERAAVTFRPSASMRSASEALALLRQVESELVQAYLELRLVANPDPLLAADLIVERMSDLQELHPSTRRPEVVAVANQVFDAQRQFTDVCRDDLWYLPKRWQVYRLGWWKARRWRKAPIE